MNSSNITSSQKLTRIMEIIDTGFTCPLIEKNIQSLYIKILDAHSEAVINIDQPVEADPIPSKKYAALEAFLQSDASPNSKTEKFTEAVELVIDPVNLQSRITAKATGPTIISDKKRAAYISNINRNLTMLLEIQEKYSLDSLDNEHCATALAIVASGDENKMNDLIDTLFPILKTKAVA